MDDPVRRSENHLFFILQRLKKIEMVLWLILIATIISAFR